MSLVAITNRRWFGASLEKLARAYRGLASKVEYRRMEREVANELCLQSSDPSVENTEESRRRN
jgi:hypothetical protein